MYVYFQVKEFLISAICYASKMVECKIVYDKTAGTVAQFIWETMLRYGAFDTVISDQGTEFCNQVQFIQMSFKKIFFMFFLFLI